MSDSTKKEVFEWSKAIIFALLLAFIIRNFVFATSIVEGKSMFPTLEDGERVIFNKIIYAVSEPDRGDIVIIERPQKNYVKRVIGLPNETIEVINHELYINGKKQTQQFVNSNAIKATFNFGPVKVPNDSYFVMGDNRIVSKDSRNGLGFIEQKEIIGRTEMVLFPFNEISLTK